MWTPAATCRSCGSCATCSSSTGRSMAVAWRNVARARCTSTASPLAPVSLLSRTSAAARSRRSKGRHQTARTPCSEPGPRRTSSSAATLSRRGFLVGTAAGTAGLVISFHVPKLVRAAPKGAAPPLPTPNAFLRIGSDDSVTVVLAHSEMGQGIWTGLAILVAEELDCDWSKVRCEHAPASPSTSVPRRPSRSRSRSRPSSRLCSDVVPEGCCATACARCTPTLRSRFSRRVARAASVDRSSSSSSTEPPWYAVWP